MDRMRLLGNLLRKTDRVVCRGHEEGIYASTSVPTHKEFFGFYMQSRFFQWPRFPFDWISSMKRFQKALSITISWLVKR